MTGSMPPNRAQDGGSQACSIQQIAAHIRPTLSHTPQNGWPSTTLPNARNSPCNGGYIEAYVGWKMTWKVSKCTHIVGVGLVRRPCANVSPASRKLNSSLMYGWGIGSHGMTANRTANAENPHSRTLNFRLRAIPASVRSTLANHSEPSRGRSMATSKATEINNASGPIWANMAKSLPGYFTSAGARLGISDDPAHVHF